VGAPRRSSVGKLEIPKERLDKSNLCLTDAKSKSASSLDHVEWKIAVDTHRNVVRVIVDGKIDIAANTCGFRVNAPVPPNSKESRVINARV